MIADGSALKKLEEFVEAQGGDPEQVRHPELLPAAAIREPILAPVDGYLQSIQCEEVGNCSMILGGGRETKRSELDLSVGLILHKKTGDFVKRRAAGDDPCQ